MAADRPSEDESEEPQQVPIPRVCDELDADIFLYIGPISSDDVDRFLDEAEFLSHRKNVALVLATNGGDAHAAYRLTRCLKAKYQRLMLFVFGVCKSAGTLVALGADQIVMSRRGEFGPLDVQIPKQDEWVRQSSGLDILAALDALRKQAFAHFEYHFLEMRERSDWTITTKTAADIAATISVGLMSPITAQIDPLRLGEIYRLIDIAYDYGYRLRADSHLVQKLIMGYSSHEFVIDYKEACGLFGNIRPPTEAECELEAGLRRYAVENWGSDWFRDPSLNKARTAFLNPDAEEAQDAPDTPDTPGTTEGDGAEAEEAVEAGDRSGATAGRAKTRTRRKTVGAEDADPEGRA